MTTTEEKKDKVYCRYAVIDLQTGYLLSVGEKWKDYYLLHMFSDYGRFFRFGWKRRKIHSYFRETTVNGRRCLICYWANAPENEPYSVVLTTGVLAGLKGREYMFCVKPEDWGKFLLRWGYKWIFDKGWYKK